ncbi:MAG: hypothetical protein R3E67_04530 [Pseudomonadales bacterium]
MQNAQELPPQNSLRHLLLFILRRLPNGIDPSFRQCHCNTQGIPISFAKDAHLTASFSVITTKASSSKDKSLRQTHDDQGKYVQ